MNRTLVLAAAMAIALGACEQQGPAEKAGERIDETMEEARESVNDAAETAGDKLEDAADKVEQKLDK